ncbi:MAG: hypothetical protein ACRDRL_14640 [Sciscionella sp.]
MPDTVRNVLLNRPLRALITAFEVAAAVVLVLLAVWMWRHGMARMMFDTSGGAKQVTRLYGSWIGGALAVVALAGLLAIDGVRQLVLALRTSHKPPPQDEREARGEAATAT